MRSRGFTLIELLVVIAIIAILAAILFPIFVAAKEKGKLAVCLGQLREVGLAVDMYAQDNGDRLPFCATWGKWWLDRGDHVLRPDGMLLPQLIFRYTRAGRQNQRLLMCPTMLGNDSWAVWARTMNDGVSYLWNHIYTRNPYSWAYATDCPVSGRLRTNCVRLTTAPILWDIPYWGREAARHSGGIVVVYADGHAKWVLCEPGRDFWAFHSCDGWERN